MVWQEGVAWRGVAWRGMAWREGVAWQMREEEGHSKGAEAPPHANMVSCNHCGAGQRRGGSEGQWSPHIQPPRPLAQEPSSPQPL